MKKLRIKVLDDYILYIVSLSLVSITMLSALALAGTTPSAHADTSSTTTTSITVTESCTMTGAISASHTAELYNGTYSGTDYSDGIGQTTIKVFCNDGMGFAIYAIGYTNDEYSNTKLHWSGASSSSDVSHDISTGIYNSGSTTNSTWSMKLASVAGTYAPTVTDGTNDTENFTTWHLVPEEYTKVAYKTTGTDVLVNGTGTGSSVTVTYDAYISDTQPAGTYIGQVKYTLVHPNTAAAPEIPVEPMAATDCPANSICYAPNSGDIAGTMVSTSTTDPTLTAISSKYPTAAKQTYAYNASGSGSTISNSTTSVTLLAPNYTREGYGFAGWSTDFTATNSSTIYGPNETITIEAGSLAENGMILYPVWVASAGNLQGWSGCSGLTAATYDSTSGTISATLSSLTALTDTRDGNVYTVARLADGQCWMVENLRLNNEDTTSAEDITLAQGYGNATTSINASGYNLGEFVGLPVSEDANFSDSTTANSLYSIDGSNGTTNIYNGYNAGYRLPRYNKNNTNIGGKNASNTDLAISHNTNTNSVQWYSYGNYYNWPAAIANTERYTTYSGTNGSDAAGTSICPTGWHLPLGYQSSGTLENGSSDAANRVGGFSYLDRVMGGTGQNQSSTAGSTQSVKWRAFPNNFIYSGGWDGSSAYSRGNSGYYWSSSAGDNYYAYILYFYSSFVRPGTTNSSKYYGRSVRCVAGS